MHKITNGYVESSYFKQDLSFPEDICTCIFLHLSLQDLCVSLQVCRLWKRILINDSFWNTKGYETITTVFKLKNIASEMWNKALWKGYYSTKNNKTITLSALKFICASNPQVQGLMIFGYSTVLDKITLKNTSDLPDTVDDLKLIRLKEQADLYDPCVSTTHISDLINCKILFGEGIDTKKRSDIASYLEGNICIDENDY